MNEQRLIEDEQQLTLKRSEIELCRVVVFNVRLSVIKCCDVPDVDGFSSIDSISHDESGNETDGCS